MQTAYYTYYRRSDGAGHCAPAAPATGKPARSRKADKVLYLDDYRPRAEENAAPAPADAPAWGELAARAVLFLAELAACGALIAVAAVACAVFLG